MQLVEQHIIDRHDPRYAVIDKAAFASKNLYNAANYEITSSRYLRQEYPQLKRRLPSLWTNNYFCATVGGVTLAMLKRYVEGQKDQ